MIRKAIPPLLCTLLLALALVLPFQGTRPLWGTDEGRYSAVAVEMLDSGDWLLPHRHPDHPHLSKPPLTYWAMASSMTVFGKNEWALRLPSALAFVLTIGCAYTIGKRLQPERPWWPALVVAGTAMTFLASNAVSTDPLVSAFETLGMTGVILAWRGESDRVAQCGAWITGLGFGLAFLTKGPPGLVPLIPTLWFYLRNRLDFRANPFNWKSLAVWAPVALSWFIAVIARYPELHLLRYFLGYETYGRIFTDQQNRHPQWYGWIVAFGPVALVGALPWTLVVAWDAFRRRGRLQVPASDPDRAVSRFLLLWLFVSLAVFCLARSRLILYVLPLLVPFALWTAHRTRHLVVTRNGKILLSLWFALLVGAKAYAGYVDFGKDARALSDKIRAQVYDPIHEIVFVNETALYGLRVYLDMPVLRVNYGDSADPAVDLSLAQAFAQQRSGRLWLVHIRTVDKFTSEVAHVGGHARQVVSYTYYRGFVIDPVSPPAIPWNAKPNQTQLDMIAASFRSCLRTSMRG